MKSMTAWTEMKKIESVARGVKPSGEYIMKCNR